MKRYTHKLLVLLMLSACSIDTVYGMGVMQGLGLTPDQMMQNLTQMVDDAGKFINGKVDDAYTFVKEKGVAAENAAAIKGAKSAEVITLTAEITRLNEELKKHPHNQQAQNDLTQANAKLIEAQGALAKAEQVLKTADRQQQAGEAALKTAEQLGTELAGASGKAWNKALDNMLNGAADQKKLETELAIKGYWQNQNEIAKNQQWYQNFPQMARYTGYAAVAVVTTYFIAKEGSSLLFSQIEKAIGKPKLVRESSVIMPWDDFIERLFGKRNQTNKLEKVIVKPAIKEKLNRIAQGTKLAYSKNIPLINIALYGPPGTGKTMFAKALAREANMDYAIMSGADFDQFKEGEDIQELHKLFDWAAKSKRGLLVFIDEADSFLHNRVPTLESPVQATPKQINLTNAFLSRVEKQTSKKLMFVFATNHAKKLDSAVLSRIGNKVQFELPDTPERSKIFDLYVSSYITPKFGIHEDINQKKDQLVEAMKGFSGRDIDGCVVKMVREIALANTKQLDFDIAQRVIKETASEKISQEIIPMAAAAA